MEPEVEPLESSPFAAFAMPKLSAVEVLREKQRKAARLRRMMMGCVVACFVGAVGGAAAWAAYDHPETFVAALVGSVSGAAVGIVGGLLLGSLCFGVMMVMNSRGRPTNLDSELARRDPMAGLQAMYFTWSLIGIAIGAAYGAVLGAHQADPRVMVQPLLRSAVVASILGEAFAAFLWCIKLRSLTTPPPAEPSQSS